MGCRMSRHTQCRRCTPNISIVKPANNDRVFEQIDASDIWELDAQDFRDVLDSWDPELTRNGSGEGSGELRPQKDVIKEPRPR